MLVAYFLVALSCSLRSQTSLADSARLNRERQKFNEHCGYRPASNGLRSDFVVYWDAAVKKIKSSADVRIREAKRNSSLAPAHVKLEFLIRRDGTLDEISVLESVGNRAFTEAAIGAIRDAAPFSPLPQRCGASLLAPLELNYEANEDVLPPSVADRAAETSPVQGTIASCDDHSLGDTSVRELYMNNVWYVVLSKWRTLLATPSGKQVERRGTARVRIEIWNNGNLKSAVLTGSTASKRGNDLALLAIRSANPYFRFAPECNDQSWMGWEFGFNYETYELAKP